jgi:N-carbamoylputrescine amidase
MKLAVAQIAPELGDLRANLDKIARFQQQARDEGANLVVFPELAVTGYAIGPQVQRCALKQEDPLFRELLELSQKLPLILGFVERSPRGRIYNAAALLDGAKIVHIHRKVYLPTYASWDEHKHFAKGKRLQVFDYLGFRVAIFICNDFWYPSMGYLAACDDADLFVVIANSSLDEKGMNPRAWDLLIRAPSTLYGSYVAFCNRVGNELDWAFWGGSTIIGPQGQFDVVAGTGEEIIYADIDAHHVQEARDALPLLRDIDVDFTLRELKEIASRRVAEND